MNSIGAIGGGAGLWGPAAGRAASALQSAAGRATGAMQGPTSLRDVEPQRGITLGGQAGAAGPSFSETLSQVLGEVNDLQQRADRLAEQLATGEIQNVHDVVIAQQEAAIAFRLIQEVRDKLVAAYQELMRMQV